MADQEQADPALPRSLAILAETAREAGYAVEVVDRFSAYLLRIADRASGRGYLSGTGPLPAYSGNDMVLGALCRDKAFCYQLLEADGFAIPEGGHFFVSVDRRDCRPGGRELDDAVAFARRLSGDFIRPLVVKPNSGARARHVYLARDETALRRRMRAIAEEDPVCLIQALIDAPEYRLFMVGGAVQFCYAKSRPAVVADGSSTVAALLDGAVNAGSGDRAYVALELERHGWHPDSVPAAGERLELGFVANISNAGQFAGLVEVPPAIAEWAERLYRSIPLEVMGVDVFSPSGLADPGDLIVTDVNGSPALATLYELGHHDLVRGVWRTILGRYFA